MNEQTNIQMDERKDENYIPLGINAGGTIKHFQGARWLGGTASDSRARGQGFETYLCRVVSLSKTLYSPKSTGNTQETAAPSRHD